MANQLIKEILLKFRSDSGPVLRDMKNIEKAGQSLQKTVSGYGGGTSLGSMNKTMDTFIKNQQKFGMTINKDMTKFQKTIQDVATKDLRILQQQTDSLFNRSQQKLNQLRQAEQNIQKMMSSGASPRRIQKQVRRAARFTAEGRMADQDFMESAGRFDEAAGGLTPPTSPNGVGRGGRGMGGFGPLLGAGAIIGAINSIVRAPGKYDQIMAERLSNQSYIAQQPLQQRLQIYEGDMTMALLAQKGAIRGAASDRERARTTGKMTTGLTLGGAGALGGLAAFGALNAWNPIGWGALGAAGVGAAGYGIKRMITGDTEKEASARYNQSLQARSDMLIDPKLYQAFRGVAPGRSQFNRRMGSSYADTQGLIQDALSNRMSVDEMMSTANNMRGVVGSKYAGNLSVAAARSNMTFGTDTQSATQMLATLSQQGKGGAKQAEKNLEDIMTRSIAAGFLDTGMRDEFAKIVTAISGTYTGGINISNLAGTLAAGLAPGAEFTKRDIEGAATAQQFMRDKFRGDDALGDALSRAQSLKFMRENKLPINRVTLDAMMSLTEEDISGKSERYRMVVGDQGLSGAKAQEFIKGRQGAQAARDPIAQKVMNDLEERAKSGKPLTPEERERFSAALGSADLSRRGGADLMAATTPEATRSIGLLQLRNKFGDKFVGDVPLTPEQAAKKAETEKQKLAEQAARDAYSMQEGVNFSGQKEQEAIMGKKINPQVVRGMVEATKEASEKVRNAGEIVDPSTAAAAAVTSMETFSTALDTLSAKINGIGGVRSISSPKSATPKTQ